MLCYPSCGPAGAGSTVQCNLPSDCPILPPRPGLGSWWWYRCPDICCVKTLYTESILAAATTVLSGASCSSVRSSKAAHVSIPSNSQHKLNSLSNLYLCFCVFGPTMVPQRSPQPEGGPYGGRGSGAPRAGRAAGRRCWKVAAGCPPQRGRRESSRSGCFL